MSTERIATLKRGRGGAGYRQKRCFLKLQKDANRKCLFCSNVSTLLSMIVAAQEFYNIAEVSFKCHHSSLPAPFNCCFHSTSIIKLSGHAVKYNHLEMKFLLIEMEFSMLF